MAGMTGGGAGWQPGLAFGRDAGTELRAARDALATALDELGRAGALGWRSRAADAFRERLADVVVAARRDATALDTVSLAVQRLESR
ncbi:hypothetical protein [Xylanimonas ulmi]|uniref:Uncharacterized protein n=1 Tax=Xylanimonas ulmi TaxID=228973 RepID=A0A4Q7M3F9_9MICO|nr:hypothetical protein [Xylanibacterium ulmi]RZS62456.1 hypothetical protein EV386_2789 [Xylanibacterium ulmi]